MNGDRQEVFLKEKKTVVPLVIKTKTEYEAD